MEASRGLSRIADVILPPRCLLCGSIGAPGEHRGQVCGPCAASLPWIAGARCERCGIELISERRVCTRCRSRSFEFSRNVALFAYLDSARELVHLYKIAGRRCLASLFAELLARAYHREYPGLPLVPVPGRSWAWRSRGWEHIDLLAGLMRARWNVPVHRCLDRRPGPPQKTLDYEGRLGNLRGRFAARPGEVPEAAVLLDDVLTTGATLGACAGVLRASGCQTVYALTIAVDE